MFCQSCGTALTKGLTYCSRCGARVASPAQNDNLAQVVCVLAFFSTVVALGGLGLIYFLVRQLLLLGFEQSRIVVVTFFCLLAVVGLAALLITHMSRALNVFLHPAAGQGTEAADTPEPAGRQTAQIEAPREPASSVTDHTTRTFDPVYQERRG